MPAKSGVTSFHFAFIYERENYISISVTSRIYVCEGVPEGEYPVTVPKEVPYGFGFTVTKKAVIVILDSHFHLQYFCADNSMEYPILKAS